MPDGSIYIYTPYHPLATVIVKDYIQHVYIYKVYMYSLMAIWTTTTHTVALYFVYLAAVCWEYYVLCIRECRVANLDDFIYTTRRAEMENG